MPGLRSSRWSPGRTFYASALVALTITAVDLSNPHLPRTLATIPGVVGHGALTPLTAANEKREHVLVSLLAFGA